LQTFTEPHSTKPIEDCVGWGPETTAETLIVTEIGNGLDEAATRRLCSRVRPGPGTAADERRIQEPVHQDGEHGAEQAAEHHPHHGLSPAD
jgi:hypothetical protein